MCCCCKEENIHIDSAAIGPNRRPTVRARYTPANETGGSPSSRRYTIWGNARSHDCKSPMWIFLRMASYLRCRRERVSSTNDVNPLLLIFTAHTLLFNFSLTLFFSFLIIFFVVISCGFASSTDLPLLVWLFISSVSFVHVCLANDTFQGMEDIRIPSPSAILAPSPPPSSSSHNHPATPASTSSNSLSKALAAPRSRSERPQPSRAPSSSQPLINPATNKPKQSKSRNGMDGDDDVDLYACPLI